MLLLSRDARREWRARRMAERMRQLADVTVECRPADRTTAGRVLTVVACSAAGAASFDLLSYIRPWWSTVQRLGLRGTVLYSGLNAEAVAAATTPLIEFVPVTPGPRHIFHERHVLLRDYLRRCDDPAVFITDASDVAFKRNPFPLVYAQGGRRALFIGREPHRIAFCRCVRSEMARQFGRVYHAWKPVLNPGILGGERTVVLEALDCIVELTASAGASPAASDMCFVNRAIHDAFAADELVTGLPLHSRFKKWEFETSAAILHK